MRISVYGVVVPKKLAEQSLAWVRATVTWVMSPGWEETIWSIEVIAPGMVSEDFLINPHKC